MTRTKLVQGSLIYRITSLWFRVLMVAAPLISQLGCGARVRALHHRGRPSDNVRTPPGGIRLSFFDRDAAEFGDDANRRAAGAQLRPDPLHLADSPLNADREPDIHRAKRRAGFQIG